MCELLHTEDIYAFSHIFSFLVLTLMIIQPKLIHRLKAPYAKITLQYRPSRQMIQDPCKRFKIHVNYSGSVEIFQIKQMTIEFEIANGTDMVNGTKQTEITTLYL